MEIRLLPATILFLILSNFSPQIARSEDASLEKLISSLNQKTAELTEEWGGKREKRGVTIINKSKASYVFSIKEGKLVLESEEKVRFFEDDEYAGTNKMIARVTINEPEKIDLGKILSPRTGLLNVPCRNFDTCMYRKQIMMFYRPGNDEPKSTGQEGQTWQFQIRNADQTQADAIIKDLKAIFNALPPSKKQQADEKGPEIEKKEKE